MILKEILAANKLFVSEYKDLIKKVSSKPKKQVAIFTCMDTRLVEFLEPALGIRRGDAKIIKNAGNTIRDGCTDVIRSLAAAVYLMGVKEILVIGHLDCGMATVEEGVLITRMREAGVPEEELQNMNILAWIGSFNDTEENIRHAVETIRRSPLIPREVPVHGLLFCPDNGEIRVVVNGYAPNTEG
ncbi:carbonic anhydrase [Thermincola ferriacetica]|uniref:carbonic anhydrase n=2 Tax=Thermincola TaxID=278993 RepID=D5X9C7_THEPJ|nr:MULTISPECIES: carbonic anhydrase [Thermincola]ADG83031.1 carbonic anhydrase [Thermincola potens JR]KNZ70497.1 carbonic anhydrase [Thermincola ferriacetica]